MVFGAAGLPVKLADKNAPADIGRFLNRRLPFAPLDYGETCACLFRDISHTQPPTFCGGRCLPCGSQKGKRSASCACYPPMIYLWCFSALRFFSFCFFFSLATRCCACFNACNAFSKFLLVSFLLSIISDTSFFLCCVDSF